MLFPKKSHASKGYVDIAPITQLTHNRKTSIRLYRSYTKKYPYSSPSWIVGKIIEDLLRDRGANARARNLEPSGFKSWQVFVFLLLGIFAILHLTRPTGNSGLSANRTRSSQLIESNDLEGNGPGQKYDLADFPPPQKFQSLQSGTTVTISNRSPEIMLIYLDGLSDNDHKFRLEGCTNCSYTNSVEEGSRLCKEVDGPEMTVAIPPGEYKTRVLFVGNTRGFKSRWQLSEGWNYAQCLFTGPLDYYNDTLIQGGAGNRFVP